MTLLPRLAILLALVIVAAPTCFAAGTHQVVIELTSADSKRWEALLNNLENLEKAFPAGLSIEVVAHGEGLQLLRKNPGPQSERLTELARRGSCSRRARTR